MWKKLELLEGTFEGQSQDTELWQDLVFNRQDEGRKLPPNKCEEDRLTFADNAGVSCLPGAKYSNTVTLRIVIVKHNTRQRA